MPDSSGPMGGERVFDYYRNVVELGTAELASHRHRFLEYNKINIVVGAAIGLVMLTASDDRLALFFVSMMVIFGLILGALWIRQIRQSIALLANMRAAAGRIEQSEHFRQAVGGVAVELWSHSDISESIERGSRVEASSGKHHTWVAIFWLVFYVLVAIAMYFRLLGQQSV